MKKKFVYFMNAFFCIAAFVTVACAFILKDWAFAFMLTLVYLLIALYDWESRKNRKLSGKIQDLEDSLHRSSGMFEMCLQECAKAKSRKMMMFNCDHCPKETPTCKKLFLERYTVCVDEIEHFDL